jgi:hypothetical protein
MASVSFFDRSNFKRARKIRKLSRLQFACLSTLLRSALREIDA